MTEIIDTPLTNAQRAALDKLALEAVIVQIGSGDVVTHYLEPITSRGGKHPGWAPGDGEPRVDARDPAVAQAIGYCVAARSRKRLAFSTTVVDNVHLRPCPWCETPTEVLLEALDHALWFSRCVDTEVMVWTFAKGEKYVRGTGRIGEYDNPAWAKFWRGTTPSTEGLSPSEQTWLNGMRRDAVAAVLRSGGAT